MIRLAKRALLATALSFTVYSDLATAADQQVVVYSSEEMIEFAARKFEEKHPDIDVKVVLGNSGELAARITAEAGNPKGMSFGEAAASSWHILSSFAPSGTSTQVISALNSRVRI